MTGTILIIALLLLSNVLMVLVFRKVKRIDMQTWALDEKLNVSADNIYKQLEGLAAIYWDVRPELGLPSMRGWAGSPDFLRHVVAHARYHKPIKAGPPHSPIIIP